MTCCKPSPSSEIGNCLSFPILIFTGFVAQRFHNYMILKVLIIFDPKLNLFKSNAYIFMQQSRSKS